MAWAPLFDRVHNRRHAARRSPSAGAAGPRIRRELQHIAAQPPSRTDATAKGLTCRSMGYFADRLPACPMNDFRLFLPCAAGASDWLAQEVHALTGLVGDDLVALRGGVTVRAGWRDALRLNLHSRLAQRVLIERSRTRRIGTRAISTTSRAVSRGKRVHAAAALQDRDHRAAQPAEKPELRDAEDQGRHRRPLPRQARAACARASKRSGPMCACSRI